MSNIVVMITGMRGSGKTVVRRIFERFHFVPIDTEESYLKHGKLHPMENINLKPKVMDRIYGELTKEILTKVRFGNVVYEATGTNKRWKALRKKVARYHRVFVCKVACPFDVACQRMKERGWASNYPSPLAKTLAIARKSDKINCNFTVDNSGKMEDLYPQVTRIMRQLPIKFVAVFLDRDGTIANVDGFCCSPEEFELLPNAGRAIRLLNEHGFKVIVLTNQSGVARGYFSQDTLFQIHKKMEGELAKEGAYLDGIYCCPHHPNDNCECHKPRPGLALQAIKDHNIDIRNSFIIGDTGADAALGHLLGCRTINVGGKPQRPDQIADIAVPDILSAAKVVINGENQKPR